MTIAFTADKLIYVVTAAAVEEFGAEIAGVGNIPLTILENSDSGEAIGFYGSELLSDAQIFHTSDGGNSEILYEYTRAIGLQDFNSSSNTQLDADTLKELITGTLNEDLGDFIEESGLEAIYIEPDSFYDESLIQEHLNLYGVWVATRSESLIEFDGDKSILIVNGDQYNDLGALVNEQLISGGSNSASLIQA